MISIAGFIIEDPYGSKTPAGDNKTVSTPVAYVSPYGTPIYTDNFDGANDTAALRARGYKFYQQSVPVGTTNWFQGNSTVFTAYNGPSTGYVGANYNATSGVGVIDLWLVLPYQAGGYQAGDSIYFWHRSPDASTYPDSIRVMFSSADSTPAGTWTEIGRFKTSTAGWAQAKYRIATTSASGRVAIRYAVANAGPSGANSDYIGIDALTIIRTASAPTYVYPTLGCNYGSMPLYASGAFGHSAAVLNDTLYITGGSSTGAGSTTSQRYAINTNTFSTGTALPESKAGHSMVHCGNAIYLIGGSSSVTVGGTTCYKYTPSTGWTSIAPLPVALSGHVAVNWGDSVIFVVGGPWSAPTTNVYFYRPASNTWGTSTACLAGRRSAAVGIVGNKIIIAAGYNAAFFKNTQIGTIGSSASTITWAAGPDVPLPTGVTGTSRPGGTGVGTKFYLIPGEMSGGLSNTSDSIRVFDATSNTWEPTLIYGRGTSGSASNYWAAVDNYTAGSGKVKVLITGGALGTVFPGLCTAQVDACTVNNVGPIETPVSYNLSQNYPNPFNPVTKISYALPKSGYVTLKVYDVLGKEVMTLVNEAKNAGNYSVEFNASNLSSGMYFYKINVNGFSEVKKMMLVK